MFGSPYTIPTVFSLTPAVPVTAATERVPETNVWRHTCREGVLTDAAPRDPACLLRTWSLREPLLFTLDFHGFRADDVTALFTGGRTLCVTVPGTAPVFNTYPVGHDRYLMLMLRREGTLDLTENGARLRMEGELSLIHIYIDRAERLTRQIGETLSARASTPYLLLMNGVDHLEAQEDLLPILHQVNERLGEDGHIFQTTMEQYVRSVTDYAAEQGIAFDRHTGELRCGGDLSLIHI